jgi:hypothetical protein
MILKTRQTVKYEDDLFFPKGTGKDSHFAGIHFVRHADLPVRKMGRSYFRNTILPATMVV